MSLPQISGIGPITGGGADPLGMLSPAGSAALNRLGTSMLSNDWINQWMISEMAFNQRLTLMLLGLMQGAGKANDSSASGAPSGGDGGSTAAGGGAGAAQGDSQTPGPISPEDKKWLTGDTNGLDPRLAGALAQVGKKIGKKLDIRSGFRSRQEQEVLYAKYQNGTGNLAAKPGTSNHETGRATDVYIDGVALSSHPQARAAAAEVGIIFPVEGEAWHAELKTLRA